MHFFDGSIFTTYIFSLYERNALALRYGDRPLYVCLRCYWVLLCFRRLLSGVEKQSMSNLRGGNPYRIHPFAHSYRRKSQLQLSALRSNDCCSTRSWNVQGDPIYR